MYKLVTSLRRLKPTVTRVAESPSGKRRSGCLYLYFAFTNAEQRVALFVDDVTACAIGVTKKRSFIGRESEACLSRGLG